MNIGLFIIGAVVTLMVLGALALVLYGAALDGRDSARRRRNTDRASGVVTRLEPHSERQKAQAG